MTTDRFITLQLLIDYHRGFSTPSKYHGEAKILQGFSHHSNTVSQDAERWKNLGAKCGEHNMPALIGLLGLMDLTENGGAAPPIPAFLDFHA